MANSQFPMMFVTLLIISLTLDSLVALPVARPQPAPASCKGDDCTMDWYDRNRKLSGDQCPSGYNYKIYGNANQYCLSDSDLKEAVDSKRMASLLIAQIPTICVQPHMFTNPGAAVAYIACDSCAKDYSPLKRDKKFCATGTDLCKTGSYWNGTSVACDSMVEDHLQVFAAGALLVCANGYQANSYGHCVCANKDNANFKGDCADDPSTKVADSSSDSNPLPNLTLPPSQPTELTQTKQGKSIMLKSDKGIVTTDGCPANCMYKLVDAGNAGQNVGSKFVYKNGLFDSADGNTYNLFVDESNMYLQRESTPATQGKESFFKLYNTEQGPAYVYMKQNDNCAVADGNRIKLSGDCNGSNVLKFFVVDFSS